MGMGRGWACFAGGCDYWVCGVYGVSVGVSYNVDGYWHDYLVAHEPLPDQLPEIPETRRKPLHSRPTPEHKTILAPSPRAANVHDPNLRVSETDGPFL